MSGIDFSKLTTPQNEGTSGNGGSNGNDRPKAQFWLNVGFTSTTPVVGEDGKPTKETESYFIALPGGIPLDSLKKVSTNSSNADYAARQQATNALYDQIMEIARSLEPGADQIVNLQVQVRRVREEQPEANLTENVHVAAMPSLVG